MPPSSSGIADYAAEQLPHLARQADVTVVASEADADGVVADLDLYHLGNSPPHAYVYRAALRRPGVVLLHDWNLHHLVLRETVERGDRSSYLREMRRAHGEAGTYVGRQVARALGGEMLPALFPLNDRALEASLAVVGLTRFVEEQARRRLPGRPVLHLPHHLSLSLDPLPTKAEARRALGLPEDALLLTAPGLATRAKRLDLAVNVVARLAAKQPQLQLVVAGALDPELPLASWAREAGLGDRLRVTGRLELADFVRHLCAADVVFALRFPCYGEISGALVRALGVGRPALVTAGTPGASEFPEGIVVPVDPGPGEEEQLAALLDHLLANPSLRRSIGELAREHMLRHHDLAATSDSLLSFLRSVLDRKQELLARLAADRAAEGSLLGYLMEEVRWGARDLGLTGVHLGLDPLLSELLGEKR
jgi:glycosyltransferase involved in cell wall biosynthesis